MAPKKADKKPAAKTTKGPKAAKGKGKKRSKARAGLAPCSPPTAQPRTA